MRRTGVDIAGSEDPCKWGNVISTAKSFRRVEAVENLGRGRRNGGVAAAVSRPSRGPQRPPMQRYLTSR
jgi:hypothetical protein